MRKVFNLRQEDVKLENAYHAGQLSDLIWEHMELENIGGDKSMYELANDALRRVLMHQKDDGQLIDPSSPITNYFARPKDLAEILERETGLALDGPLGERARLGEHIFMLGLIAFLISLFFIAWPFIIPKVTMAAAAVAVVTGLMINRSDRGCFAPGSTVDGVVKHLIWRNFGVLARRHGQVTREAVWEAARAAMGHQQSIPASRIDRETVIYG